MQLSVLRYVGTTSGYGCCGVLVVGILVDGSVGGGGGLCSTLKHLEVPLDVTL